MAEQPQQQPQPAPGRVAPERIGLPPRLSPPSTTGQFNGGVSALSAAVAQITNVLTQLTAVSQGAHVPAAAEQAGLQHGRSPKAAQPPGGNGALQLLLVPPVPDPHATSNGYVGAPGMTHARHAVSNGYANAEVRGPALVNRVPPSRPGPSNEPPEHNGLGVPFADGIVPSISMRRGGQKRKAGLDGADGASSDSQQRGNVPGPEQLPDTKTSQQQPSCMEAAGGPVDSAQAASHASPAAAAGGADKGHAAPNHHVSAAAVSALGEQASSRSRKRSRLANQDSDIGSAQAAGAEGGMLGALGHAVEGSAGRDQGALVAEPSASGSKRRKRTEEAATAQASGTTEHPEQRQGVAGAPLSNTAEAEDEARQAAHAEPALDGTLGAEGVNGGAPDQQQRAGTANLDQSGATTEESAPAEPDGPDAAVSDESLPAVTPSIGPRNANGSSAVGAAAAEAAAGRSGSEVESSSEEESSSSDDESFEPASRPPNKVAPQSPSAHANPAPNGGSGQDTLPLSTDAVPTPVKDEPADGSHGGASQLAGHPEQGASEGLQATQLQQAAPPTQGPSAGRLNSSSSSEEEGASGSDESSSGSGESGSSEEDADAPVAATQKSERGPQPGDGQPPPPQGGAAVDDSSSDSSEESSDDDSDDAQGIAPTQKSAVAPKPAASQRPVESSESGSGSEEESSSEDDSSSEEKGGDAPAAAASKPAEVGAQQVAPEGTAAVTPSPPAAPAPKAASTSSGEYESSSSGEEAGSSSSDDAQRKKAGPQPAKPPAATKADDEASSSSEESSSSSDEDAASDGESGDSKPAAKGVSSGPTAGSLQGTGDTSELANARRTGKKGQQGPGNRSREPSVGSGQVRGMLQSSQPRIFSAIHQSSDFMAAMTSCSARTIL